MFTQFNNRTTNSLDINLRKLDKFIAEATHLKDELENINLEDLIWEDAIEGRSEVLNYACEKKTQINDLLKRADKLFMEGDYLRLESVAATVRCLELMSTDCDNIIKECESRNDVGSSAKRMRLE